MIVLIFFTLLLVLNVVKYTPVKLELIKPNSETAFESIGNISGNLSIKNSRKKIISQSVERVP